MIIQNPLLTGSLNYNGADLSNVTSSNANSASVSLILTAVSSSNQQLSASYISLSGSYNVFSGSASTRITTVSSSQQDISSSLLQVSASYIALSGSYNTFSGSASTRVTKIENNYATTGSNSFRADQSITGSLVVSSTITAQTLVVQTVTSSIVYSSGSNNFGNQLSNNQTFTGSVNITGSQTVFGNVGINAGLLTISASSDPVGQYYYMSAKGATNVGFSVYEYSGVQYVNASGSMILRYNNMGSTTGVFMIASGSAEVLRITAAGNLNIGRTDDFYKFSISSGYAKTDTNNRGLMFVGSNEANASNPFGLVITVTGAASIANRYVTVGTTDFGLANGGNLVMQTSTGNVGIGTTAPTEKLTVYGAVIRLEGTSATGITPFAIANNGTDGLRFYDYNAAATRMSITGSTGYVGINNTAPLDRLDVAGNIRVTVNTSYFTTFAYSGGTQIRMVTPSAETADNMVFKIDGASSSTVGNQFIFQTQTGNTTPVTTLSINKSGDVSIGTTTSSKYQVLNLLHAANTAGAAIGLAYSAGQFITNAGAGDLIIGNATGKNILFGNTGAGTTEYARITSGGNVYLGPGYSNNNHRINKVTSQSSAVLVVSGYDGSVNDTAIFYAVSGVSGNAAASALNVSNNTASGRSINAGGSINASGTDYAEYMEKAVEDIINKGDIVGVNSQGKLTNIFNDAISFVVKSTDPAYVGGDTWGTVGSLNKPTSLYTEEELQQYKATNEAARAIVDRIAFSGQVPCNVTGANVGDYIIPIELENGKISGQAVTNPTFEQYQISVGKVWKIMEDGRAWIAVKIG